MPRDPRGDRTEATLSAFIGLLGLGWDLVETIEGPRGTVRDDLIVVAHRTT